MAVQYLVKKKKSNLEANAKHSSVALFSSQCHPRKVDSFWKFSDHFTHRSESGQGQAAYFLAGKPLT